MCVERVEKVGPDVFLETRKINRFATFFPHTCARVGRVKRVRFKRGGAVGGRAWGEEEEAFWFQLACDAAVVQRARPPFPSFHTPHLAR